MSMSDSLSPIITNLPDTQRALQRKYTRLAPQLQQINESIAGSLLEFDTARANRGAMPLSSKDTFAALSTAVTGKPYTPVPKRNGLMDIPHNIISDAGNVLASIPRLPLALYKEARALPSLPGELSKAMEADSLGGMIAGVARAPGIRFLPGAYTAGNIASGEMGEIAAHPLFTALDLLPLAKATPAGIAATDAFNATKVGKGIVKGKAATSAYLKQTSPGQFYEQAFKERGTARANNAATTALREQFDGKYAALQTKYDHIPLPERVELYRAMTEEGLQSPAITGLSPDRAAYVLDVKTVSDDLAKAGTAEDFLTKINGEYYDNASGGRLLSARFNHTRSLRQIPEAIRRLEKDAGDVRVDQMIAHLQNGDVRAARKIGIGIKHRKQQTPGMIAANDILKDMSVKTRKLSRVERDVVPARYKSYAQAEARRQYMTKYADDPEFSTILPLVAERSYGSLPEAAKTELANSARDIAQTWGTLKGQGIDPVFISRVSPGRARAINFPRVGENVSLPSWAKARTNDMTPYVEDAMVALSHQGLELLQRNATEAYWDAMYKAYGRSSDDIAAEFRVQAEARYKRDPRISIEGHQQELMNKQYVAHSETGPYPWMRARVSAYGKDMLLPKAVAENIRRMHNPTSNFFTKAIDKVYGPFRVSVLALSPRNHVNNVFGGGMMLAAYDPAAFRFMGEAVKMVKNKTIPKEVPQGGMGTLPREALEWNKDGVGNFLSEASGRTMGRIMSEAAQARTKKALSFPGKVAAKSFEWNGMVDDAYRAMAYLSGQRNAVNKGMSSAAAQEAGIQLTRKIFQEWDAITPIERNVMRYIFPFYGFSSHVMKQVMKYPFDHPYRTEILSAFTRNELADQGESMPDRFLNTFFFGKPDKKGNVKSINIGGLNPYSSVANMFTLKGMAASTGPLFTTGLQTLGVDLQTGGPELFPNLRYDPETGKLAAKSQNPFAAMLGNTIPQTNILMGLFNNSSEFRQLLAVNPSAAGRLLMSQGGLPTNYRSVNVPQVQFKGELARRKDEKSAQTKALKSGNDAAIAAYPGLAPLIKQLRDLQSKGELAQFTPTTTVKSPAQAAQAALLGRP